MQQPLQRLLRRSSGRDARRRGDSLGTGAVRRLGEHRLARIEVGVEAAVREAGLLHDVRDAGAIVATAPDGACGGLDDTFVRNFFGFWGGSPHMMTIIPDPVQSASRRPRCQCWQVPNTTGERGLAGGGHSGRRERDGTSRWKPTYF